METKCELFFLGANGDKLLEIQQVIGFKLGTLFIRYLGVPLVSRRLTEKDCSPLVDKITRINHCAFKFLSCVGRF